MTPNQRIHWQDQSPPPSPDSSRQAANASRHIEFHDLALPDGEQTNNSHSADIRGNNPSSEWQTRLNSLEANLNQRIIGQNSAIRHVVTAIRSSYLGLNRPDQPRHVFAFLGSTGVGKTAAAVEIANLLFDSPTALNRLNMPEFKDIRSIYRITGWPPGVRGGNNQDVLAARISLEPECVVLLDEFDKCHLEVLDVFLQIFDNGCLTDANGRVVDCSQAVFILTSNLYSGGRAVSPELYTQQVEAIRLNVSGTIRSELVNRIHSIVLFRDLTVADLEFIACRELDSLNVRLHAHHLSVQASPESLQWIAEKSLDPASGARSVIRNIAGLIAEPLSTALIAGRLSPGRSIPFSMEDGQPKLNI